MKTLKLSEAISDLVPRSETLRKLNEARMACRNAGLLDEETVILMKLKLSMEEFGHCQIVLGV